MVTMLANSVLSYKTYILIPNYIIFNSVKKLVLNTHLLAGLGQSNNRGELLADELSQPGLALNNHVGDILLAAKGGEPQHKLNIKLIQPLIQIQNSIKLTSMGSTSSAMTTNLARSDSMREVTWLTPEITERGRLMVSKDSPLALASASLVRRCFFSSLVSGRYLWSKLNN